MELITDSIRDQLLSNWRIGQLAEENGVTHDPLPVVRFFNPIGSATWLFTEMVAHEPDVLFGLCDLGQGFPELGYASLKEIESVTLMDGMFKIERDINFTPKFPISVYAEAARAARSITDSPQALLRAKATLEREAKAERKAKRGRS